MSNIDLPTWYDNWKATPPEEPDSRVHCAWCGKSLYEGDFAMHYQGEVVCPKCLEDELGFRVSESE